MNDNLVATVEILIVIVGPLLYLYLKGKWPIPATIPSLLVLPVLWYLSYAPLHELSHAVGTYLVGGKVVTMKWIPHFWRGEFGGAWITPVGLTAPWQNLAMTASPYLLDVASTIVGYLWLRKRQPTTPFPTGLLLMLLSLRPAFDLVCELVGFARGYQGDLFHLARVTGRPALWSIMLICIGLSACFIALILSHSTRTSEGRILPDRRP